MKQPASGEGAPADDSGELASWQEDGGCVNRAGDVHIELRSGGRSLTLQISAAGTHAQKLARTRFGDVSYNEVAGLSERAAAAIARAWALRLDAGASDLPARFPHLALERDDARLPGSHRDAVAALWPRDLGLPAVRDRLRLDADGVRAFLAPELSPGGAAFAGFLLRSIADTGDGCELELVPAVAADAAEPLRVALSAAWREDESFGAPQKLTFAIRQGGTDRSGDLRADVARFCSLLAVLLELKQSPSFALHLPDSASPDGDRRVVGTAREGARPASASLDVESHRFAIRSSGYTMLRQVLPVAEVAEIAAAVDRALAAMEAAAAQGRDLAYTFYDKDTYVGTRCLYCWGDACVRLIENDVVREIAAAVIGPHKLFDMSAHRALPSAHLGPQRTEEWHRDIDVFADSSPAVRYLWFFVPLVDFTAENGATWIVPGSQRLSNEDVPPKGSSEERFPTRVQLLGKVGDVFVINPSALHSVGHNATAQARTMINLGVCHATVRPLLDHWAIAGPAVQSRAGDRLRAMLGAGGEPPLDTTWSVLPEGWVTSSRGTGGDPAARVFPPEQQGYQRSHRIRDDD